MYTKQMSGSFEEEVVIDWLGGWLELVQNGCEGISIL
jgi:hypothetical protein